MPLTIQEEYDNACETKDFLNRERLLNNHDMDIMQECDNCEDIKEAYKFYRDHSRSSGLRKNCIGCQKQEYQKKKEDLKRKYYNYEPKYLKEIRETEAKFRQIVLYQEKLVK